MHITQFKTHNRYVGPFEVVKQTSKGNYVLREMDRTLRAAPVAAFRVVPYLSRCDDFQRDAVNDQVHRTLEGAKDTDQEGSSNNDNSE